MLTARASWCFGEDGKVEAANVSELENIYNLLRAGWSLGDMADYMKIWHLHISISPPFVEVSHET